MNTTFKKSTSRLLIALFAFSALSIGGSSFAAEKTYKVGDRFNEKGIAAGKNPVVLQILNADLNKDKKNERVYLIGSQFEKGSLYYDQITYVIQDGKTKKSLVHTVKDGSYNLGGYEPKLTVTDLNKDGQSDLFLSAPTGGSGGFVSYDLSTLKNGKLVSYLSQNDLKGLTIEAKFLDNYQVALTAKEINKTWTLNVSHNAKMYQETKVYDQNGKFIGIEAPYSAPISYVEIVDQYGGLMLKGSQSIKGIANADTLATIDLYMAYEQGKWQLKFVTQTTVLKAFE